jgi:hypothetical protein
MKNTYVISAVLVSTLLAVFGCGGNTQKEKTDTKVTEHKMSADSNSITKKYPDTAQTVTPTPDNTNTKNESATLVPKNETTAITNTGTLTAETKNGIPDAPKEKIEKAPEVANTVILDECKRKSNQLPTTSGGLEDLNIRVTELQAWIPNLMGDYSGKYAGPIDAEISQMDLIVSNTGILAGKMSLQTEVASPDGSINPVIGTYPLRSGRVKGALAEWQNAGKSNYTIGQFVSWKNANGSIEYGLLAADSEKKVFTLLRQIK